MPVAVRVGMSWHSRPRRHLHDVAPVAEGLSVVAPASFSELRSAYAGRLGPARAFCILRRASWALPSRPRRHLDRIAPLAHRRVVIHIAGPVAALFQMAGHQRSASIAVGAAGVVGPQRPGRLACSLRLDFELVVAVVTREDSTKGFFVAFDYAEGALREIDHFFRQSGKVIVALTVGEILDEQLAKKLA